MVIRAPARAATTKAVRTDYKQAPEGQLITQLLEIGLRAQQTAESARREAEKGTATKANPYVTDAGKCQRATGYTLLGEPKSNTDSLDSLIAFKLGRLAEQAFSEALTEAGCTIHREVRIEIPIKSGAVDSVVSGRIDFLIEHPALLNAMVELKTTNSRAMHKMLERKEYGSPLYRRQLNLYLEASQQGRVVIDGKERKWAEGFLTYIVKDSVKGEPSIVTWLQPYDRNQALDDLGELATIKEAAALGLLPGRPYAKPQWQCNYCPFKTTCWKGA